MYPLDGTLPGQYVPVRVTRGALVAHRILIRRLAAKPPRTAGLLFPSRCPSGTILLTQYSMVWDYRGSRAGRSFFIGLSWSIPTMVFYYFSLSLLSVYWLVLWGLGLRTDMVYITLSFSLALPASFNNNNNKKLVVQTRPKFSYYIILNVLCWASVYYCTHNTLCSMSWVVSHFYFVFFCRRTIGEYIF